MAIEAFCICIKENHHTTCAVNIVDLICHPFPYVFFFCKAGCLFCIVFQQVSTRSSALPHPYVNVSVERDSKTSQVGLKQKKSKMFCGCLNHSSKTKVCGLSIKCDPLRENESDVDIPRIELYAWLERTRQQQ